MYQWMNEKDNIIWNAIFSKCCKHKWIIEKWIKIDGTWKRTNVYKRFDTLEEARQYALRDLKKIA